MQAPVTIVIPPAVAVPVAGTFNPLAATPVQFAAVPYEYRRVIPAPTTTRELDPAFKAYLSSVGAPVEAPYDPDAAGGLGLLSAPGMLCPNIILIKYYLSFPISTKT